ncbi:putative Short chain dehydrogenase/reductase family oxidoreductase [Pleurostoma richardsiae]|uniref:Short chain dehydrogenase/reductase family oxidoreductase n=1 Tax=Pleurostoma richardsiae TaxID=41990 RepID=A0AA38VKC6_9PEZI|nr:putative Short chain dehydrogenase/reductase family oxidoreductase [Pleurostoma richardsiae]
MSTLKGRVYTVTGAASGIGQAVAIHLVELGASGIAISDVNKNGLEETKELCSQAGSTKVVITRVDVSQADQVTAWVLDTVREFGRLDGAANVAGIAGGDGDTTCQTIKQQDWDRMLNVNLNGVMYCMRAQLPHLPRPGGAIVNVSSTSGLRGLPHNAAYATSKFGVIGLTESAAGEFGRQGIRVNALLPGPIDTSIFRDGEAKGLFNSDIMSKDTCLGRMGKAHEVAKVLCFMLTDDASYVTGAHWTVDGGYSAC